MSHEIIIPSPGESVTEITVGAWLKQDGDWVEKDEAICEIESDKATLEVGAPNEGILSISAREGEELDVGAVLGTVEPGEKPAGASPAESDSGSADAPQATPPADTAGGDHGGARASTVAKKIAQERGVDLKGVTGSGPSGRIMKADVMSATEAAHEAAPPRSAAKPTAAPAPAPAAKAREALIAAPIGSREIRRERMTKLRQKIAERLVSAQHTAAMLTTFNEADMTGVMSLRSRYKDDFEKRFGVRLGFMSFFVKASISALRAHPKVNAYIVDNQIEYHDYNDIAVAVGTDRGLVVPVIRNAEGMNFAQIEGTIGDFAARAKTGALSVDEMTGGTFTVSNGGVYGSMMSTPILNPPQSGILGMHAIKKRAVEDPDNPGQIILRPMMYLALSYDHRIIDGTEAVTFLKHIKDCIEDPARLLFDA
ncbi:MAG: dihydrolipoyllysine-residue succinyltransferase [Planctomycetaceae bacterium]|nr:dihydrolipoyllysine-residue succinyltransferase [Planctomycetaceae bacterium]